MCKSSLHLSFIIHIPVCSMFVSAKKGLKRKYMENISYPYNNNNWTGVALFIVLHTYMNIEIFLYPLWEETHYEGHNSRIGAWLSAHNHTDWSVVV